MKSADQAISSSATNRTEAAGCCAPVRVIRHAGDIADEARVLSALADATRLRIVELLAAQDEPLCVCDIVSQFELGQPTISHHLKVLREARLVNWEKRGLWVHYSLNREALEKTQDYLHALLAGSEAVGAA